MKRSEIAVRCQGLGEVVARLVELAEGDPPRPVDHGSCVKPADGGPPQDVGFEASLRGCRGHGGGILKKCVTSQAVYPLSEQHGLKARERRYTAHEEGKHWE